MKKALITGITGQDGSYLSKLLLDKGYEVVGLTRSYSQSNLYKLDYLDIKDEVILTTPRPQPISIISCF
jgi:GDPmannose 4,6-dehydratase